jgi:ABC-type phosphate transport system ATPase subunit
LDRACHPNQRQPIGTTNADAARNRDRVRRQQNLYRDFLAVRNSRVSVPKGTITGLIGPSGCGKSTVLRSLNRMNDMVQGFRLEGHVHFLGQDIYDAAVDPWSFGDTSGWCFSRQTRFR